MGRTIKSTIKLEEVYFDEDLYPRSSSNWITSYDYSESIKSGAKFPPIVLALFKGKKYLVDGKHRIEAHKILKLKKIDAIIHTGWNIKRIFEESIKANIAHGKVLSQYDKRKIIIKLREMEFKDKNISKIIQIPLEKMERFVATRMVNSITGKPINSEENLENLKEIGQAILKSGLKHYAGETLSEQDVIELEETQKSFFSKSQYSLFFEVNKILENNLLDKDNPKVMEQFIKLKDLLLRD